MLVRAQICEPLPWGTVRLEPRRRLQAAAIRLCLSEKLRPPGFTCPSFGNTGLVSAVGAETCQSSSNFPPLE